MKFYEDMRDKFGFGDGEAMPFEAEQLRQVYVMALNRLAKQTRSGVRAYAYNRPGMHNWCLLLFAPAELAASCTEEALANGQAYTAPWPSVEPDEAMDEAIDIAHSVDLDWCVEVETTINWDTFKAMLDEPVEVDEGVES